MSGISSIAVIGAGRAGRTFARRCVEAGFHTVLEDVMPAKLRRAQDEFALAAVTGAVAFAQTVEDAVRTADLAVDFVPDELESKLEIISMLDRMAPPRTILCVPTVALSLADLASCTYRAGQVVGVRGDGAAGLLDGPVQLIRSRWTTATTLQAVREVFLRLGMPVVIVEDAEDPVLTRNG